MKKQAILIIAHKQFELLNMILRLLDSAYFDFYIHIDKKAGPIDTGVITNGVKESSVYFLKRIPVTWGAYSLIEVELELLSTATQKEYSYYHLISGQDLPIKKKETIYNFFENSGGKQFIEFGDCNENILNRLKYYHVFQERRGRCEQGLWYALYKISRELQKICHVNRLKKQANSNIYYGSQWFSITHEAATYVCSKEKEIRERFSNGIAADELFLQSIMMDSATNWNLAAPAMEYDNKSCMRFVDWTRGGPYVFRTGDFDLLMNSKCMFARKFDLEVDSEICERIYNYIL